MPHKFVQTRAASHLASLPRLAASLVSLACLCLLASCGAMGSAVGPVYERPALELPASLEGPRSAGEAGTDWLQWWKGFQDPVLDALMQEAVAHNQDLALASARVDEARATLDQNASNFWPTVDLNASASRKRSSQNTAGYSAASPLSEDRLLGLSASYEFDFWGRYAKADEAARARLLAQQASRGTVLATLCANVAQSWFALRALDAQAELAEKTLATRQENLRLQKRRLEAGLTGQLDYRQAESEAAALQSSLQTVRQSRSNAEAALALLLGRKPGDIVRPVLARGETLGSLYAHQRIPAQLPTDLLTRRPDIMAAEQSLMAANADIGQARAAYLPRFSITATAGQESADMSTLMNPASLFWNLVGNLTQPVFRAGAIGALVAASNARQQQALAQYTQSVQNAFKDVHDAINNVDAGKDIAASTAARVAALRETLRLSEMRYRAGYSGYIEVLSAQRDLFQAESALIDVQRSQLSALVSLYRAVGGGWAPPQ